MVIPFWTAVLALASSALSGADWPLLSVCLLMAEATYAQMEYIRASFLGRLRTI